MTEVFPSVVTLIDLQKRCPQELAGSGPIFDLFVAEAAREASACFVWVRLHEESLGGSFDVTPPYRSKAAKA